MIGRPMKRVAHSVYSGFGTIAQLTFPAVHHVLRGHNLRSQIGNPVEQTPTEFDFSALAIIPSMLSAPKRLTDRPLTPNGFSELRDDCLEANCLRQKQIGEAIDAWVRLGGQDNLQALRTHLIPFFGKRLNIFTRFDRAKIIAASI